MCRFLSVSSTQSPSLTPTATSTATPTPSQASTASHSQVLTPSSTETGSQSSTSSGTQQLTGSPTQSGSATGSPASTPSQSQTRSQALSSSQTQSASGSGAASPSASSTSTSTQSQSLTKSATPTQGATPSQTASSILTVSPTPSVTASQTLSQASSSSQSQSSSLTATRMPSQTTTSSQTTSASYTQCISDSRTLSQSGAPMSTTLQSNTEMSSDTGTLSVAATPTLTQSTAEVVSSSQARTESASLSRPPSLSASPNQPGTSSSTQTPTRSETVVLGRSPAATASPSMIARNSSRSETVSQAHSSQLPISSSDTAARSATPNRNMTSLGTVTELPATDLIVVVLSTGGVLLLLIAVGCCLCWRFCLAAAIHRRRDSKNTSPSDSETNVAVVAARTKRASVVHPVPLSATDVDAAIVGALQPGVINAVVTQNAGCVVAVDSSCDRGVVATTSSAQDHGCSVRAQEHDADKVVSSLFVDSRWGESSQAPQVIDACPRHLWSQADCNQTVAVTRIAELTAPVGRDRVSEPHNSGDRRPSFLASSGASFLDNHYLGVPEPTRPSLQHASVPGSATRGSPAGSAWISHEPMWAMPSVQLPLNPPQVVTVGMRQRQLPAARGHVGPHVGGLSRAGSMIGLHGGRLSVDAGPHAGGLHRTGSVIVAASAYGSVGWGETTTTTRDFGQAERGSADTLSRQLMSPSRVAMARRSSL